MENKLEAFRDYLKEKTSESSAYTYCKVISTFLKFFGNDSVENMNLYIEKYWLSKYAFIHYLRFLGRENDIEKLKKGKRGVTKREGVYLERERLKEIIFSIPETHWRVVALLQYLTGARAKDVLRTKKEWIEKIEDDEKIGLKIKMLQKGNRFKVSFIPKEFKNYIWEFVESSGEYPFLKYYSKKGSLETSLSNNYVYYWKALKNAAVSWGYNMFAPHDFRRNFLDLAYTIFKDIRKVRELAGHRNLNWTFLYLKKRIEETELKDAIRIMQL